MTVKPVHEAGNQAEVSSPPGSSTERPDSDTLASREKGQPGFRNCFKPTIKNADLEQAYPPAGG